MNEKIIKMHRKKMSHDNKEAKTKRLLITVNVLGSVGPIRFLVDEDDEVSTVIDMALKSYAHEGRLPALGFDANNFLLYQANAGSEALSPHDKIGSRMGWNFVLCKKQQQQLLQTAEGKTETKAPKRSGWKAWLKKPFSFKVLPH